MTSQQSKDFFVANHLLGSYKETIALGLVENDVITSAVSMKKYKSNLAINRDVLLTGKLFNGCIDWAKNNKCNSIVVYSDNRWSSGETYQQLGFELKKELSVDFEYINPKKPIKRIPKNDKRRSYRVL